MHDDGERDPLIERLSQMLRVPERAGDGFVARVLADVTAQPVGPRWWQRRFTVRVTPVGALALAVAVALVAVGLGDVRELRSPSLSAHPDTVYVVRFLLTDSAARGVMLVGSFNNWTRGATPLERSAHGLWSATVLLPKARYEYAFVVDRDGVERWVADPLAPVRRDDFGTTSSVVTVGGAM